MSNRKNRHARTIEAQAAVPAVANDRTVATDGFVNFAARMGVGARNLLSDGNYYFDMLTRNRIKLEAMYRGNWIVGQMIDCVAEDMTRAGITVEGDTDPAASKKLTTGLTRLGIWRALTALIKWGRLYGGAIAYIHVEGQDPESPLDVSTVGKDQFRGLRVFDRWQTQPDVSQIVEDGVYAGTPMFYRIVSDISTGTPSNLNIHYSRVIRFTGIDLPAFQAITEQLWGESVIERLNDRLISFDTATMGAANLVQKAHLRTVQIKGLREIFAAGGDAEENLLRTFRAMAILQSNEGVTLLDSEDVFDTKSYTFSGLSDVILQFGQQLSGATSIPLVRLFGQSPAGLSATGESDLRTYYDGIANQQEARLRDGLHKVLRVMYRSLLAKDAPEDFDFSFNPLWQTSETERATIAQTTATAVGAMHDAGIIDQATALQELKQSSEVTGIFSNITDEQIEEAKAEPPPMPETGNSEDLTPEAPAAPQGPTVEAGQPSALDRIKSWISR
jgi:phage-related protein (TIGR01555 family)